MRIDVVLWDGLIDVRGTKKEEVVVCCEMMEEEEDWWSRGGVLYTVGGRW